MPAQRFVMDACFSANPSKTGTLCVVPPPTSSTMPVVRPDAKSDMTDEFAKQTLGASTCSKRICASSSRCARSACSGIVMHTPTVVDSFDALLEMMSSFSKISSMASWNFPMSAMTLRSTMPVMRWSLDISRLPWITARGESSPEYPAFIDVVPASRTTAYSSMVKVRVGVRARVRAATPAEPYGLRTLGSVGLGVGPGS
mmetsp:Transcript_31559/g.100154  ORF Transcript_31559/g.100154 Transcript_31559/m.100154 type:complete len:200 (-) Transcript_31559:235-834(-)